MHFTIDKDFNHPDKRDQREFKISEIAWVPGHSVGSWRRHIVELAEGDTADNPASTGFYLSGPALIVYDVAPDGGINTTIFDNALDFYKRFKTEIPVEDIEAIINYNWEAEARDYEQCELPESENETTGHVFEAMRRVAFWLAGTKGA